MTLKVSVVGAKGRMGETAKAAIESDKELTLHAAIDQNDEISQILGSDVIVDFTTPEAVMQTLEFAIKNDIHAVVGTTGFNEEKLKKIEELLKTSKSAIRIVSNFSIGAILMMRFAEEAAKYYESAEIVEIHHPSKKDAPSGTSQSTAKIIADARAKHNLPPQPDSTSTEIAGARGANVNDIKIHALRVEGAIAHQETIFGSKGELLTIRHDSFDRESFMPGVLLAVKSVANTPGLTMGINDLIN
jgi:4-hydroxy-tetrahydrodipicolinate reductase